MIYSALQTAAGTLLYRVYDLFFRVLRLVAQLLLILMVAIIFLHVCLRYLFNSGIFWSEEVALLFAIWFIFIAMAIGVRHGLHIRLNLLPIAGRPVLERMLTLLGDLAIVAIALSMLLNGLQLIGVTLKSIMPATRLPSATIYLIVPPVALLMLLTVLVQALGLEARGSGDISDTADGTAPVAADGATADTEQ